MNMAIWGENGIQIQKEALLRGNAYSTTSEGFGEKSSQENRKNLEITIFPKQRVYAQKERAASVHGVTWKVSQPKILLLPQRVTFLTMLLYILKFQTKQKDIICKENI